MVITIVYNDGSVIQNVTKEDLVTALSDIEKYADNDKTNPYSIQSIHISPYY